MLQAAIPQRAEHQLNATPNAVQTPAERRQAIGRAPDDHRIPGLLAFALCMPCLSTTIMPRLQFTVYEISVEYDCFNLDILELIDRSLERIPVDHDKVRTLAFFQ